MKGVTYKLQKFLGPEDSLIPYVKKNVSSNVLIKDEQKQLYHVIVYLGPGDYHHFHSPSDWTILKRRHFPGMSLLMLVYSCFPIIFMHDCMTLWLIYSFTIRCA